MDGVKNDELEEIYTPDAPGGFEVLHNSAL